MFPPLLHIGNLRYDGVANSTAFGCRDCEVACLVGSGWCHDKDEAESAQSKAQLAYNFAMGLLSLASGAHDVKFQPDHGNFRLRLGRLRRTRVA